MEYIEQACSNQCDQTARLCFQFWPFTAMKIYTNSIHYVAKVGSNICPKLNKPYKIAKVCLNFANMAKFRQSWSHWQ